MWLFWMMATVSCGASTTTLEIPVYYTVTTEECMEGLQALTSWTRWLTLLLKDTANTQI